MHAKEISLFLLLCFTVADALHLDSVRVNVLHDLLLTFDHALALALHLLAALVHLVRVHHLGEQRCLVLGPRFLQLVLQLELVKHVVHYFGGQDSVGHRERRIVPRDHHFHYFTTGEALSLFREVLDKFVVNTFHTDQLLAGVNRARVLPEELRLFQVGLWRSAVFDQVVVQHRLAFRLTGTVKAHNLVDTIVNGLIKLLGTVSSQNQNDFL